MTNSKLTVSDVIDIRRLHGNGATTSALAEDFGVDARHIRRVVDGSAHATVPQDKIIKKFTNYAVTVDGRVYSFSKGGYLSTEEIAGKPYVRLSKTNKNGERIRQKIAVAKLVQTHF